MGHNAERYYAQQFREMGYTYCRTSREGSRLHDNCKIDLIFIPFNTQIKAGKQKGFNPVSVLKEMNMLITKAFPPDSAEFNHPKIVIHKKESGRGNKRTEYDETVTMTFEDFKKLIKTANIHDNQNT
jgi:hypothetical protein